MRLSVCFARLYHNPTFAMFAVPGWSVDTKSLKTQTAKTSNKAKKGGDREDNGDVESRPSKKRKRTGKGNVDINPDNLAHMWERVIENKDADRRKGAEKRQKIKDTARAQAEPDTDEQSGRPTPLEEKISKQKSKNNERRGKLKLLQSRDGVDSAIEDELQSPAQEQPKNNKKREKKSKLLQSKDGVSSNVEDELQLQAQDTFMPETELEMDQRHDESESDMKELLVAPPTLTNEEKMKRDKKEKKRKKHYEKFIDHRESHTDAPSPAPISQHSTKEGLIMPKAPPATPLTPLQAEMRSKLISARFRHLNEQLYTTNSAESLTQFSTNSEMFLSYHEGFRNQVEVWPENPVHGYFDNIVLRGQILGPAHKGKKQKISIKAAVGAENASQNLTPLPRTGTCCTIADLGCGDATLAIRLQPFVKKLDLKIKSFDLQAPNPHVQIADIANLPLPDTSVDVAIFCLALMGTNWIDFIEEAFRILRWKGELWVAEIKSRFGRVASAGKKGKVVEHSVGNRKKVGKEGKKIQKRMEEDVNDAVAAVEVDGVEDRGGQTDVSAFVEVLKKRGFVLKGEGKEGDNGSKAVDLSNKMFVKMWFVKATTPIKGKGVPLPKGGEKHGLGETWTKKPKGKFIEEEQHVSSEAGVLKPCIYKQR
ncbi:uncharacterized protein LY89DRAFT_692602 [Mollisia scopiformis]|uniref:Ribosomal RNA-processing protein 8 n=1 Tax=Mollisia scopiformis TaxID=149040 RepID=A0A132B1K5_MOLSC|nr:uncharacterized protein LY89DRAFT_692602 [Mollisia scopiformis]KUJ06266.1 hypothetical protein LY89DRAFT_692602 [Mollisia scopiformis]